MGTAMLSSESGEGAQARRPAMALIGPGQARDAGHMEVWGRPLLWGRGILRGPRSSRYST